MIRLIDAKEMSNSVDPDQTAPLGAVCSGPALLVYVCLSQYLEIFKVNAIIVGVDNMQANTVQHHSTLYSGASEIAAAIGKLASLQLKTLKLLMKS